MTMHNNVVLDNKVIAVTGGTGSFGQRFVQTVLSCSRPKQLVIVSRDELKQFEMAEKFADERIRYVICDVRDYKRLCEVFSGVDYVIHAAALKQVTSAEHSVSEVIKTNILGTENVIHAAMYHNVNKIIILSTDKAVCPVNLYGATKLCAEKLCICNNINPHCSSKLSVVRYGNVVGSRGSVVPFFQKKQHTGIIPITDINMIRFWITPQDAVEFIVQCLGLMCGGEIFVPKMPSMRIVDLARIIAPKAKHDIIGIKPGEKLYEVIISEHDACYTFEYDHYYIIYSPLNTGHCRGMKVNDDFVYNSRDNTKWLTDVDMHAMIDTL